VATWRRAVAKIQILPPDVVPMSKEDEQQAIQVVTMIAQWWKEHGRDGDPPDDATSIASCMRPAVYGRDWHVWRVNWENAVLILPRMVHP
jgi:hypothetical protein